MQCGQTRFQLLYYKISEQYFSISNLGIDKSPLQRAIKQFLFV